MLQGHPRRHLETTIRKLKDLINLARWACKGISTNERDLAVLLLPRGLITAIPAIQVMEARGGEFIFLRASTFAVILVTNMLVILGSLRARRATPQFVPDTPVSP